MKHFTLCAVALFICGTALAQTEVKLTSGDAAFGDTFGYSVSINGDTAVVGANLDDDAGASSGSAYIFDRNQGGADNWGQAAKLTAGDASADDNFGWSVSISGDTAAVGAYADADAGAYSGSVYIFFGGPVPVELQSFSVE